MNSGPLSTQMRFGRPYADAIRSNVFTRLRSFAFNILKANSTSILSQDRYRAALAGIESPLELII
jgi:hypothetical protein